MCIARRPFANKSTCGSPALAKAMSEQFTIRSARNERIDYGGYGNQLEVSFFSAIVTTNAPPWRLAANSPAKSRRKRISSRCSQLQRLHFPFPADRARYQCTRVARFFLLTAVPASTCDEHDVRTENVVGPSELYLDWNCICRWSNFPLGRFPWSSSLGVNRVPFRESVIGIMLILESI